MGQVGLDGHIGLSVLVGQVHKIPRDCPTCPIWDIGFDGMPEGF